MRKALVNAAQDKAFSELLLADKNHRHEAKERVEHISLTVQSNFHVAKMCLIDTQGPELARIVGQQIAKDLSADESGAVFFAPGFALASRKTIAIDKVGDANAQDGYFKRFELGVNTLLLLLAAFTTSPIVVLAQSYPRLSGALSIEVQDDNVYHARTPAAELNDLYIKIEPELRLEFSSHLSLNAGFVLEPVINAMDDRAFEDEGLYVEQLYLQWSDAWSAHAGKYNPAFGMAWDQAPGIYGSDFAEDYEITEQWGAGVVLPIAAAGSALGNLALTADVFFTDATVLSRSAINSRGRTRRIDGGAGNVSGPRSFSFTLGSEEIASLPGFAYRASALYRAAGKGDPREEKGAALALTQRFDVDANRAIELLAEGAYIANAGGSLDNNTYLSAGAAYLHGPWNLSLAGALRRINADAASDTHDRLLQIAAGYSFESGLGIDVGWRYGREDGERTRTLGAVLSYAIEF